MLEHWRQVGWDALLGRRSIQATVLIAAAFLIRSFRFGDPVIHIDEQFYLLVGDRLLHGMLPYVDLWDRKPLGLFLIYAAIRLLGGDGILAYQIVGTLFAAATAYVIARLAVRITTAPSAVMGGVAYLLGLCVVGGEGGQAPVFFNLLVCVAAALTARSLARKVVGGKDLGLAGSVIMVICGTAIQIKYTTLFEGVFLGVVLLDHARRGGARALGLLGLALVWVACALLPTGAALLTYAALGHADEFWFANFSSIFYRAGSTPFELGSRLWIIVRGLWPVLIAAVAGCWLDRCAVRGVAERQSRMFLGLWLTAAVVGFLTFGTYFDHYALPLLPPLCVNGAPVFQLRRHRISAYGRHLPLAVVVLIGLAINAQAALHRNLKSRGDGQEVTWLANEIRPRLRGCMYVYDGDPILYMMTGACFATAFVFPNHLDDRIEAHAIGIDPNEEMERIMTSKPSVIVANATPDAKTNLETWSILQRALERDYHPFASRMVGPFDRIAYERNGGS